jgi:hypothetical protein
MGESSNAAQGAGCACTQIGGPGANPRFHEGNNKDESTHLGTGRYDSTGTWFRHTGNLDACSSQAAPSCSLSMDGEIVAAAGQLCRPGTQATRLPENEGTGPKGWLAMEGRWTSQVRLSASMRTNRPRISRTEWSAGGSRNQDQLGLAFLPLPSLLRDDRRWGIFADLHRPHYYVRYLPR